jgi:hypothetical protein
MLGKRNWITIAGIGAILILVSVGVIAPKLIPSFSNEQDSQLDRDHSIKVYRSPT